MNILIADKCVPEGIEALEKIGSVTYKPGLSEDELCEAVPEVEALMVRSATKVTARVLEAGSKLKVVGRAGIGVDNIDVPAATLKGIMVCNSPQGNVNAVCEFAVCLMLNLLRMVPQADKSIREGKWQKTSFLGGELRGRVLGVVGLGNIGLNVAEFAGRFGMTVVGYDPNPRCDMIEKAGVELLDLDDVFRRADIVTIHTPLLPSTKGLASRDRIYSMKPGSYLLNMGRGGTLDETALADALNDGHLTGAALDVFNVEKPFQENNPLLSCPGLLLTPHTAGNTEEALKKAAVSIAEQFEQVGRGKKPTFLLN